MDDRKRTIAAVTVLVGLVVLILILIGAFVRSRKIISPVPEDGAIRIIFVTPTPTPASTPTPEDIQEEQEKS